MNYSNSFDVLQEDDRSNVPVEKQLRNKNKKLREIERLKSKPYDQLNEAQRAKIELEKQIRDEIEYIEESMKEQSKSQTPYQHRPVQKKRKKNKNKNNAPKSKKKNKMTKKQREAYEKHKEKVKENVNEEAQKQKKRKRNWNETRRRHQEEQERLRQQEEQERMRRQAEQERIRQEAQEQEKLKKLVKPHFPNIPVQKIINIAMKFALRSKQEMSIEDALKKIADAGRMFTIKDILNLNKRDIIRKYRKLSLKHHPDKGGSHEMMLNVNNANDILNELISYN